MSKKKIEKKARGLRTLFFYGVFVFCLIMISFAIRLFSLMSESKFDGAHRFTLLIGEEKKVLGLISFEPMTSSLSLLTFSRESILTFSNFNRNLGVIPDGRIRTSYHLVLTKTVPSIFQSFIFHQKDISTNINFYDLLRLYMYSNKVPVSLVNIEEASISSDPRNFNKTASLLLADSGVTAENVSVQIVNAAGEPGLGGRLERVISNLGGNVVLVKTALATVPVSKIQYYGQETYTLRKLAGLLSLKREVLDNEDIAQIVIIIGEDNKDTLLF